METPKYYSLTYTSFQYQATGEFAHGYRHGASIFYVIMCNERVGEKEVSDVEKHNWNSLWIEVNDLFKAWLRTNPHL
jgi:hypothetical protein